jgi:hypothetical protein
MSQLLTPFAISTEPDLTPPNGLNIVSVDFADKYVTIQDMVALARGEPFSTPPSLLSRLQDLAPIISATLVGVALLVAAAVYRWVKWYSHPMAKSPLTDACAALRL